MPTIRQRGDKVQAIVRVKRDGAIVYQESRMFGPGKNAERLARDWAERLEASLKLNGTPQRHLKVRTLGWLLREYLTTITAHGPIRRTRASELAQLAPYFDKVPLSEIRASTFADFSTKRRKEGAGPVTVLHNLATLRSVLNAARAMYGYEVDGKPVAEAIDALSRVNIVSRSASRERRPTADELTRLDAEFARVANYPSTEIPMQQIVKLAVAWPRRLGELCGMKWNDFNKAANLITLRDTKNPVRPRDEVVPLTREGRLIIDTLPVLDERILPYNSESVSAAFQRACARLNIVDLRFHDLRHEGITRLFETGLSIQEVALVSGHLSWTMLRRYTHLNASVLSEKLNAGVT